MKMLERRMPADTGRPAAPLGLKVNHCLICPVRGSGNVLMNDGFGEVATQHAILKTINEA